MSGFDAAIEKRLLQNGLSQFGLAFAWILWRLIRIRLLRKLALAMNGVDVSRFRVGDIIELSDKHAQMMVREDWGEFVTATPTANLRPSNLSQLPRR